MTKTKSSPAGRLTAVIKRSGMVLAVLAALTFALYVATPSLVTWVAPRLAERFDFKALELDIGYPKWRGIDIDRFVVITDTMEIRGQRARIDYGLRGLREGQISGLTIDELEIRLPSAAANDTAATEPPVVEILFPNNPVQQLSIKKLTVVFPDSGFIGVGHAQLGGGLLSLSIDGVEPELASRLSITADLSRDGVFHAVVGERDIAGSRFLSVDGLIAGDSISIDGTATLSGFPLQLASELIGLPPGTGEVSGQIRTDLPWPLPDTLVWQDVVAVVPVFSVDWQSSSEDLPLTLRKVSGSARLERGNVEALVAGSALYHAGQRELTAELPADYRLQYQDGTLAGAAGPRLTVRDDTIDATAIIQAFSLRDQPATYLDVEAEIDARVDNLKTSGTLNGRLDGSALSLTGHFDLNNNPPRPRGQPVALAAGAGTFRGRIETSLPSPLPETLAWQALTATVPSFALDWKSANNDLKVTALAGSAELQLGKVIASVSGAARYRLSGHDINVKLPKDYRISFQQDKLDGGPGPRLSLKEDQTDVVVTVRSVSLQTTAKPRLDINAAIDAKVDSTSSAGRLAAHVKVEDPAGNKASGRVDYSGLVKIAGQQHDGKLGATFSARGNALNATGTLNSGLFDKVPLTLIYNLDSGAGTLLATHTFDFRQSITTRLLPDWKAAYDLDAGRIEAELTLNWQSSATIAADLSAQLTDGRAHYEDYLATGINGHLNLRVNDSSNFEEWRLEPTVLRVERIDAGIPIDNLLFELAWSGDQVQIRNATATVLGGQANADEIAYIISTGSTRFAMGLNDIDLAMVLALEGDDVIGSGKLSGSLPVIIEDNMPRIEAGKLVAAPPGGHLRLTPTMTIPIGQQNLAFALTALQDFSYTELTTQVDYTQTGDLALAVHLQGRNPAVEKGRPIRYNLNISENVPMLLESLRLQDKLTEGIENKLRK